MTSDAMAFEAAFEVPPLRCPPLGRNKRLAKWVADTAGQVLRVEP
jgi:hypothetical protein